ncbi:conserved exported hypothetical protein [Flavobacterium sp. 9AF]|uniref:hypothetical protein n=1 Tax=Flavobacterium sp. 9AF TaxID=2653142 RepID=UPI0012F2364C|nr:hypothetical protein [Flavobacterium sp. 9AF]VXB69134.1 conserved exported hypothetical protein [Flavobacterium sp. 9AF]
MKKINNLLLTSLFLLFLFQSCTEVEVKHDEPTQLISNKVAKELNQNYNRTRHSIISQTINKEDANSAWYSLEELENYIYYVKKQGKEKGYDVDGIRFYLGAYPDTQEYDTKANMTTIFLTPTGKKTSVQKGSVLNLPAMMQTSEENADIEEISPMNFGTMGHPPKAIYPSN